jgi:class 3 adenylate cyclase
MTIRSVPPRAALDIHEALDRLNETVARPLKAHVGVASGEVVAGTMDRVDVHDYTVLGDSVNLAARLVAAAGPGESLLSDDVYRAMATSTTAATTQSATVELSVILEAMQ